MHFGGALNFSLALSAAALALGACAVKKPAPRAQPTSAQTLPPCDTVSGTATSVSRGTAMANAERNLAHNLPEARGDLLGSGYRRIRVIARDQQCAPYRIGGIATGLTTCVARARVCGR